MYLHVQLSVKTNQRETHTHLSFSLITFSVIFEFFAISLTQRNTRKTLGMVNFVDFNDSHFQQWQNDKTKIGHAKPMFV